MENLGIVGRKEECRLIEQLCNSKKAEMVAIYGRRRVGKTFLVRRFFDDRFDFYFTGSYEAPKSVQLKLFRTELERYGAKDVPPLKDWVEAFEALRNLLSAKKQKRIVIFLDELPWMDTAKSNFLAAFSYFWNSWASAQPNLKLFVCGSATTWMLEKLIGDKGGLYGRICRSIYLAPFTLNETEQYLNNVKGMAYEKMQVLETYMIMGGIPYYLDMMDCELPFDQNIDKLFFKKLAPLKTEFDFLFRSLFKNSKMYKAVVVALSSKLKGMTRQEIAEAVGLGNGGTLSEILENLCRCDFLRKYIPFGKATKDALYQLSDMFSLFYLRFEKECGQDESFWSNIQNRGERRAWYGYAFEQVCLIHLHQIKESIGIGGVLCNSYGWSCKPFTDSDGAEWDGAQVDLVLDRADNVVNLCEMKFSNEEFVISKDYEKTLRERIGLFKHVTKTKKAVTNVLVSTYGVKRNMHSSIIQSEVTMEGLFKG